MVSSSTVQLLRIPFSYFLMPVYWFAVSFANEVSLARAVVVFVIIHLLVYPASNGYNSYMDRDESSIGGVEKPLPPTRQLFYTTIVLDVLALLLSFFVSGIFFAGIVLYIICSRLYSYRGTRLKKYPVIGYLTVILNQGAVIFFIVWHGVQPGAPVDIHWQPVVAAAFLIGGFYPITQIYQHEADAGDGVKTISMLLGIRGTFLFCAAMYLVAFSLLFVYLQQRDQLFLFAVLNAFFLPVVVYFFRWMTKAWNQPAQASFKNTMRMNWLASTCTSLAFITITLIHQRG